MSVGEREGGGQAAQSMTVCRADFEQLMFPCYRPQDFLIERAHGAYVYDDRGRRYTDFTAGIAVNCLGHTPRGVRRVIRAQSARLLHCSNIFVNRSTLTLAAELLRLTGFERAFFANSGAEVNEAALKLARRAAYDDAGADKDEIVAADNSFHGRTFFSVCVGGHEQYAAGFGPRPGAITHVPFNDVAALQQAVSARTCAVILEPIQGEGGIIPATPEYLAAARACCDRARAALIFDEIQTGVGRTGDLYAFQRYGVRPDILTTAKGLAAGLPLGAVLTSARLAAHFSPGTHGTTFGGNPLACAVGTYVLRKVVDPDFLTRVRERGALLQQGLRDLNRVYRAFAAIRGAGLLVGAQLTPEWAGRLAALQRQCTQEGLLVLTAGHDVLRLAPPLNIRRKVLTSGLAALGRALKALASTGTAG